MSDLLVIPGLSAVYMKIATLASTTASNGASKIGINDAGSYYAGTNVEQALQALPAGSVQFQGLPLNIYSPASSTVGMFTWNSTDVTADLKLDSNTTLQVGQETLVRVVNKTGSDIADGVPVYISGAQGQRIKVGLAKGDIHATSKLLGITTEPIVKNQEGFVTVRGLVHGIQTNGGNYGETWVDGDALYVSKTTAGAITNILPVAPNHQDQIGWVVNSSPSNGSILVNTHAHKPLDELSDVDGSTPTVSRQPLTWDQTNSYWTKSGTWFDDLRIEPTARGTGPKIPSYSSMIGGIYAYEFDDTVLASEKEINFKMQLPYGWKTASAIHLHLHWVAKSTTSAGQKVRWGLEYTKANINGVFGATTTIYATDPVNPPSTTPTAMTHYLTEFADIDMSTGTISNLILGRIFRNSSDVLDTYTDSAYLIGIDAHIEYQTLGSASEYSL
jgi:hypothetical protein